VLAGAVVLLAVIYTVTGIAIVEFRRAGWLRAKPNCTSPLRSGPIRLNVRLMLRARFKEVWQAHSEAQADLHRQGRRAR
jgi:hypothetical protein